MHTFCVLIPILNFLFSNVGLHICMIGKLQKCIIAWELRVVGWEVSYGAEFMPNAENAYTIVIQKTMRKVPTDEPVVSNTFKVDELGKILLTVDNPTSKKKKLLYRFKIKSFLD